MSGKGGYQPNPLKITTFKSILSQTIPHEKKSLRCFTGEFCEADIVIAVLFLLEVP